MPPSTHKKVVLRLLAGQASAEPPLPQGDLIPGYINPAQLALASHTSRSERGQVELLTPGGQVIAVEPNCIQAIFFVAGFDQAEALRGAGYLGHTGPRLPGLWVRVRCRDHQSLEGILSTGLLELEAGVTLTPLYRDSPCQRLFVPRTAIEQMTPVEVVREPRRRRMAPPSAGSPRQIGLFGGERESDAAGSSPVLEGDPT